MSLEIIPEKYKASCDACKSTSVDCRSNALPPDWGVFQFCRVAKDFTGHAVVGHQYEFDLCATCSSKIHEFIKGISK